jgi:hypothetical protein
LRRKKKKTPKKLREKDKVIDAWGESIAKFYCNERTLKFIYVPTQFLALQGKLAEKDDKISELNQKSVGELQSTTFGCDMEIKNLKDHVDDLQ